MQAWGVVSLSAGACQHDNYTRSEGALSKAGPLRSTRAVQCYQPASTARWPHTLTLGTPICSLPIPLNASPAHFRALTVTQANHGPSCHASAPRWPPHPALATR